MDDSMEKQNKVLCFVCGQEFLEKNIEVQDFQQIYEQHLMTSHRVLIPKCQNVDDLLDFIGRTKNPFNELQSDFRCNPFSVKKFNKTLTYYIIDKDQMEDEMIKNVIEKNFLENILNEAQRERNETFSRQCLFCKKIFTENRSQFFDHLFHDHNFFVGHPDNILHPHEFLDVLEEKLKNLFCLYCEREFKSWNVLKEHMRKKGHKTLNPNNREYDKFYLINYLCSDKHWIQIKKENDFYIDKFSDEWCDWIDDDHLDCKCFFCPYTNKFDQTRQHLLDDHRFDFTKLYHLDDFYDRIKTINYMRKSLLSNQCYICQQQFDNFTIVQKHLHETNHITKLPEKEFFNSPEYYFPTMDDDCFLLFLDEFNED